MTQSRNTLNRVCFEFIFCLLWSACATFTVDHTIPDSQKEKAIPEASGSTESNAQRQIAEKHFSMAQAYAADGNIDRTIEEYKLALSYDPDSVMIMNRLATEYVRKGLLTDALELAKDASKKNKKDIESRMIVAGILAHTREFERANDIYDEVLKLDKKNIEAVVFKAQIMAEAGKIEEAEIVLQQFLKHSPESEVVWYSLGRIQHRLDKVDSAILSYTKSLEIRPDYAQAAASLGVAYEALGNNDKAIEVYRELFSESQDLSAANRLAILTLKQEKYKDSVPYLEAIYNQDPDDLNSAVRLGLVYLELKELKKALTIFQAVLKKTPDSDRVTYYAATTHLQQGEDGPALELLKKIGPESSLYGDATLQVVTLLKKRQKHSEAKNWLKSALNKDEKMATFYLFLASFEEEDQKLQAAADILEKGARLFQDDEKILYYLGTVYEKLGRLDKSISAMERVIKINPEHAEALNYVGYLWTEQGIRLDDAERLLKKAKTIRPNSGYIQDSWGWHLYVRGRVDEAIVELEKAAKLSPSEPTILDHLADAYLRMNLKHKAAIQYEAALSVVKDPRLRKKIALKLESLKSSMMAISTNSEPSKSNLEGDMKIKRKPAQRDLDASLRSEFTSEESETSISDDPSHEE